MEVIRGTADEWQAPGYRPRTFAGPNWMASSAAAWTEALKTRGRYLTLDLSNVDFVTPAAWVCTVAMIERMIGNAPTAGIEIDLKGRSDLPLLSAQEYISERTRVKRNREDWSPTFAQAWRMYEISGFLESLGTSRALNRAGRGDRLSYKWLGDKGARVRSFHTRRDGKPTIVMPLMRIESKENCKEFLNREQILAWREAMGDKFRTSPLFEFEELWRIFCHELAVNVYEHSTSAGFLSVRIVEPEDIAETWCLMSYRRELQALFPKMSSGFIELCVSDGGQGFFATLQDVYRDQAGIRESELIPPEKILAFAFDEIGTSKKKHESWATERHALGRILQIVSKYGGGLTLRSSGAEVMYIGQGGAFERLPNHLGYRPQVAASVPATLGSHLQLILPLVPFAHDTRTDGRGSILVSSLPDTFHADPNQVRGHLVPLFEALDSQSACVGTDDRLRFQVRCEALARRLINERPPLEPLVLDFSSLNWTSAQFETLLYLLQNVLQNRPVLFVEIDPVLARQVIDMEQSGHTELHPDLADKTPGVSGRAYNEHSEEGYLETYQRVHSTVLGLDINGNPHIFGLKQRWCEPLILSLIKSPKTLENLCLGRTLEDQRVLKTILNQVNPLFYRNENGSWQTVWNGQALGNEARRAMSKHFDAIAERCMAWRGRSFRQDGSSSISGHAPGKKTERMTFNLPWQEEWVCEFFESSRILSRQRYADEAAQRLIFRLEKGLKVNDRVLGDVLVLACVTAPAILLATALHRWWPDEKRPAIADLGPYLMLNPDGTLPVIASAGGIVVIQDVLDRGRISRRLVRLLKSQHKEVLCILSLARLVDATEKVGVTAINEGWHEADKELAGVKTHAMINLLRPERCPASDHRERGAHWVEPRTLRPFRYSTLRRELQQKTIPRERLRPFFAPKQEGVICAGHYVYGERHYTVVLDVKRALDGEIGSEICSWIADLCLGLRNSGDSPFNAGDFKNVDLLCSKLIAHKDSITEFLWESFSPKAKEMMQSADVHEEKLRALLADELNQIRDGPSIYQPTRFSTTRLSNTTAALLSKDKLTPKVSRLNRLFIEDALPNDILRYPRAQIDWENERSRDFDGDVSAVLMPLHSQIHYLWPRIESLLAQRGRRQPMWLLDATLFLGHGPAYRLPLQFDQQIATTINRLVEAHRSGAGGACPGLRILILDDAMVSARTAETMIAEIDRAVAKACEDAGINNSEVRPIEWIRYFTVFNFMSHARYQHWRSLTQIGTAQKIPFLLEDYRSIMGVPVFEELNCPCCKDIERLEHLIAAAERRSSEPVRRWAVERLKDLMPIAIDSPGFQRPVRAQLPRAIDLLARTPAPKIVSLRAKPARELRVRIGHF